MRYLLIITLAVCILECNTDSQTNQQTSKATSVETADAIRQKKTKNYFAAQAEQLNLPAFNQDIDSFELRLWVSSTLLEHELITLTFKNSLWQTHKFRYFVDVNTGQTLYKEEKIKTDFSAKTLADSINLVDFSDIISQNEIENFRDVVADGITYDLEITTKHYYKEVTYHCPELYAKEVHNKKFLDIIHLLDKHFHFLKPCHP